MAVIWGSGIWWSFGAASFFLDEPPSTENYAQVFLNTGGIRVGVNEVGSISQYNPATGAWTPDVTLTPANLDDGLESIDPGSGAAFVEE